jgi:hypothetical protein
MIRTDLRRVAAPLAVFVALFAFVGGCAKQEESTTTTDSTLTAVPAPADQTAPDTGAAGGGGTEPVKPATPPDHVVVQHILIGFSGSIKDKPISRTQADAEKLANDVLARARAGENFDGLVQAHTDDQFPGVYGLANTGVTPDQTKGEYARGAMVAGFGDVAFELSPGNVGMSPYDAQKSPFGWHIIKRLE